MFYHKDPPKKPSLIHKSNFLSTSALVNFHLLDSVQCSEAIMAGSSYETLEGNNIVIGCDGESLTVNGIKMVLKKDIVTTNGVIHLIDKVLMPDSGERVVLSSQWKLVENAWSVASCSMFQHSLSVRLPK